MKIQGTLARLGQGGVNDGELSVKDQQLTVGFVLDQVDKIEREAFIDTIDEIELTIGERPLLAL